MQARAACFPSTQESRASIFVSCNSTNAAIFMSRQIVESGILVFDENAYLSARKEKDAARAVVIDAADAMANSRIG